jgi:hypothetical protein
MNCHSGLAFAESANWRSRQACAGIPLSAQKIVIAPMHRGDDNQTFETASCL